MAARPIVRQVEEEEEKEEMEEEEGWGQGTHLRYGEAALPQLPTVGVDYVHKLSIPPVKQYRVTLSPRKPNYFGPNSGPCQAFRKQQ